MSPLEHSTNLAARMGRWSARHRRTAIAGWIAFVVAAAVIGAVLGTEIRDPDRIGIGESQRAEQMIDAGAFVDGADESVLVASATQTAGDPSFRAVLADVDAALAARPGVSDVASPLISEDRHAALVRFEVSDVDEQATTLVEPVLGAVAAVQQRHPGFRVEQFGAASAQRAFEESIGRDFTRAEYTAIPITLAILVVVFGAFVAAAVPLLVGAHVRDRGARPARRREPGRRGRGGDERRRAARRSRRRRRLLALLPQARAARSAPPGRATRRRSRPPRRPPGAPC